MSACTTLHDLSSCCHVDLLRFSKSRLWRPYYVAELVESLMSTLRYACVSGSAACCVWIACVGTHTCQWCRMKRLVGQWGDIIGRVQCTCCWEDGLFGKLGWWWCRSSRNSLLHKGGVKRLVFEVQMLAMHVDVGDVLHQSLIVVMQGLVQYQKEYVKMG